MQIFPYFEDSQQFFLYIFYNIAVPVGVRMKLICTLHCGCLCLVLIVVLPCILISSKLFCQQMHSLLKHKMLQLTIKIALYMAPTCFGPLRPSSGSIRQNLAKVTVSVEIVSKKTSLKLLLCSGNMCCVYWVLCSV
jgi:hypothetical protein